MRIAQTPEKKQGRRGNKQKTGNYGQGGLVMDENGGTKTTLKCGKGGERPAHVNTGVGSNATTNAAQQFKATFSYPRQAVLAPVTTKVVLRTGPLSASIHICLRGQRRGISACDQGIAGRHGCDPWSPALHLLSGGPVGRRHHGTKGGGDLEDHLGAECVLSALAGTTSYCPPPLQEG